MPGLTKMVPFPSGIHTHPLHIIDFELLKARDEKEIDSLWMAATETGFWYLKNHGVDEFIDKMFDMGEATVALPLEEKMKYYVGEDGENHGYKAAGINATDEWGSRDNFEFINIAKDDALGWPDKTYRKYPPTVTDHMEDTVVPFVRHSMEVNYVLLDIFNARLGLPDGTLKKLNSLEEHSDSDAVAINMPAKVEFTTEKVTLAAHSDFGTITFLNNRLGGLQVLTPGSEKWEYVLPIPGHAVCNVGDALTIFSGGILRSNMHRVLPPPGEQANYDRMAVVYFTRPGQSVVLRPLVEHSKMIADAYAHVVDKKMYETGSTAKEWFKRRIMSRRLKHYTGPESYRNSHGTEHQPHIY